MHASIVLTKIPLPNDSSLPSAASALSRNWAASSPSDPRRAAAATTTLASGGRWTQIHPRRRGVEARRRRDIWTGPGRWTVSVILHGVNPQFGRQGHRRNESFFSQGQRRKEIFPSCITNLGHQDHRILLIPLSHASDVYFGGVK